MNGRAGETWEWLGFEDEEGIRVTLLVLERTAWDLQCVTLDSSREDVWPAGEVALWSAAEGRSRWRRIA